MVYTLLIPHHKSGAVTQRWCSSVYLFVCMLPEMLRLSPRVSPMFLPRWKTFHSCKMYACSGSLLVASMNVPHLSSEHCLAQRQRCLDEVTHKRITFSPSHHLLAFDIATNNYTNYWLLYILRAMIFSWHAWHVWCSVTMQQNTLKIDLHLLVSSK